MAGLGDSWGTEEELLHPRGPDGRWIRKAGIAKSIFQAVLGFLQSFSPRTFQNQRQSTQYLHNISRRQGKKRFGTADLRRLYDLPNANEDLRDGVIDNPSTGRFVEMMDRTETELPDDVILSRIVPLETFGYTAQTATGTNSETDPGIREMSGRLVADRGYSPMTMGNVDEVVAVPPGSVRMVVAAKKGTKVNIPGGSSSDHSIFLTRDQPLRITKIKPDGRGGWTMYVTTDDSRSKGETPEAIGGPRGLQVPPTQEREAAIRDLERISATREGRPDEVAEQADIEARRAKAEANAAETPVPSPAQEAERKRVEALTQQPAPGEPPPRTEPAVGRVGEPGAPAPGGAPTQAPEATVPSRAVDLRLAVRDAGIPSPSAGSRRRLWNEHYLGVASGKKDPIDAVRELDRDIEILQRGGEPGGAVRGGLDEDRPKDVESYQKLRDLIAQEYGLPGTPSREERTKAGLPKVARGGKTRMSQRELEAEERNRAAGAAEAIPAPTPAKKAPAKKAAKKATGGPVRTKDQEDRILSQAAKLSGPARNEEEERLLGEAEAIRAQRAGAPVPVKKAAKKAAPAAPGDDIDKMTKQQMLDELERRGVETRKSWNKDKLKDLLRDVNPAGMESQHKEGQVLPRLKTGARTPIERPEDLTPEEQEQRRREAEGLQRQAEIEEPADLDKMTKSELLAEAERRGVEAPKSWTKDRIKKQIREAKFRFPDAKTPEQRREIRRTQQDLDRQFREREAAGEGVGPAAPETDLDKMSKKELIAEAGRRGVTARESWTKDRIKKEIRDREKLVDESDEQFRREMREELEAEFEDERQLEQKLQEEEEIRREEEAAPAPVKKAAKKAAPRKLNSRNLNPGDRVIWERPGEAPVHGVVDQQGTRTFVNWEGGRRERVTSTGDGGLGPNVRLATPEEIEEHGTLGPPREEPRAPAAKAAVPGAAPGTAAGKITAGRIQPGMRVLVGRNEEKGYYFPSTRKTGQTAITVDRFDRISVRNGRRTTNRLILVGHDDNGNEIRVEGDPDFTRGYPGHQTFIMAPEPGAAPAKKAAKAAAPESAPTPASGAVERIGPQTVKVGDTIITGRDGGVPVARMRPGAPGREVFDIKRSGGRYEFYDNRDQLIQSANPNTKMNVRRGGEAPAAVPEGPSGHPGDTGMARALIPEQRERQVKLDRVKAYGTLGTEVDELLANEASPKALAHRIRTRGKQQLIPDDDLKDMLEAAEAGDNDRVRKLARGLMDREGITQIGSTGDVVPLDGGNHQSLTRGGLPRGTTVVHVVRPGSRAKVDGDDILIDRAVVEPATPEEIARVTRAKQLVPEGSVTGPRTGTPVDNAPRKRELRKAWIAADIQPPPGPVRTQTEEIRDKLLNGDVTPEEGIRMMESEIAFNKEDLAELDAHLRDADLTPAEKKEFQDRAVKLTEGIREQEKAAAFLKLYFKEEAPVVSIKEMEVVDPVSYEFLKDATPDDLKEAAKEAGLDAPSGDTPDEMFTDLLKQVARKALEEKRAKKKAAPAKKVAKKAAPAPAVPKERERIDARLVGAGLDFDENDPWVKRVLDDVQKDLDGDEKTPAAIGRELDDAATRRMTTAVYEHGAWHAESSILTEEERAQRKAENQAEYDRVKAEATKIRELGKRLEKTRRKPVKKAAPATPKEAKLQDKVDDLEKRRIDDALGELTQSGDNRDRADAVLEGLTLPELRRLAEQSGVPTARTKRKLRDNILDRFVPRPKVTAEDLYELPSRDAATEALAPLNKAELQAIAAEINLPGYKGKSMERLRLEIREGTTGARLDSIATRGFTGPRPDMPDAPRPKSLSRRATEAGITHPGEMFSDVDSAVGDADARLRAGESPTMVARFLRERAARVAKADIMEEGRRFRVEHDKDSLLSIRKSSAEYLRRVATHVQQEGKAKKVAPRASAPEVDAQIQTVYQDLADRPGAWVPLADVRERLSGMDRADVDAALERLAVQPGIHVIPWDNRKALTDRDRAASVRIGGDDAHAIRIEAPTPAKKAAPSAPEAPDTQAEVKKLRDRARVTRELAGMRQANNPPGSFHHNKGLQDEKDADRLDAEADALERDSAPAPAKKAAKKAAPRPDLGEQVKILARGTTREERAGTDFPSPSRTGTSPVGGTKSTKPIIENTWGGSPGEVHFHNDGIIGQELGQMGDDRSLDVDGEPLANVVGRLATDAVMGRISQDQLIQRLKALAERLPEGSAGRRRVESMAKQLDAPERAPLDLPDGTPGPITSLMQKLSEIPLARGTDKMRQRRDTNEMDTLRDLAQQAQERYPGNEMRQANWLSDQLRQKVLNHRHESEEGKFQIDRAVREAMEELDRIVERLRKGASAPPAAKKATPRLTAIPGGGAGRGRGTRPKLTVVRNEQGEFAVAWV